MSCPLPRAVGEGSHLAIIAPAGPFNEDAFRRGVEWLGERYRITHSPDIFTRAGFFAGNDERRLAELKTAVVNPEIDAILCARGGYGVTRLLPDIDVDSIREANKTVVGFSDISALHAAWARAGVRSIHAPMVAALGNAGPELKSRWISALEHPGMPRSWYVHRIDSHTTHTAAGTLLGGNLAVLTALNGTPYAPPLDGAILFLEDVGERPYRVDRMLTTLKQSGWFERISGLVLGAFTEGEPGPDGVTVDEVFCEHFADAPYPVLSDLSAGHIDDNEPLPFGCPAKIEGKQLFVNG